MFVGLSNFIKVKKREMDLSIRVALRFAMDEEVSVETRTKYTLWHFRGIFGAFQRKSQEITVSAIVSSLNKNLFRISARKKTMSYITLMADKLAA